MPKIVTPKHTHMNANYKDQSSTLHLFNPIIDAELEFPLNAPTIV